MNILWHPIDIVSIGCRSIFLLGNRNKTHHFTIIIDCAVKMMKGTERGFRKLILTCVELIGTIKVKEIR